MKLIRLTYDRKGNVLSVRFSEKKEAASFAERYHASTNTARRTFGTPALRACHRS